MQVGDHRYYIKLHALHSTGKLRTA